MALRLRHCPSVNASRCSMETRVSIELPKTSLGRNEEHPLMVVWRRFPTRSFSDLSCRMEQAALPSPHPPPLRRSASRAPRGADPTVALLSLHCRLTVAWKARQCRVTVASSARGGRVMSIFGPLSLAIDTMNFQLSRRCDPIPARPAPGCAARSPGHWWSGSSRLPRALAAPAWRAGCRAGWRAYNGPAGCPAAPAVRRGHCRAG